MIAYASRTGTRRNLAALRQYGWRILISATGPHRNEGFQYAIDNGAWTAHQQGTSFDEEAFRKLVDSHGIGADWIVLPDIVAGGLESLDFSMEWLEMMSPSPTPLLLAVQDGMGLKDIEHLDIDGIFIGGTTSWKLKTMQAWSAWCLNRGLWCHVGRVNTRRRIRQCAMSKVTSFDGTSASRFSKTVPFLDEERRQLVLMPDEVF